MFHGTIGRSQWWMKTLGGFAVVALLVFGGSSAAQDQPKPVKPWVAPADARNVKNPVPVTPEGLAAAAKIFTENCVLCHGEKGKGDGEGGKGTGSRHRYHQERIAFGKGGGAAANF